MTLTIRDLAWGHPVPGGSWRQLFEGFNLDCPAGQYVVVIGSNGSGKSTLLNLIAGTLRAGGGSVQLEGRELLGLPDHRRSRAIGRVMQNPLDGTAPALTIAENLRLAEPLLPITTTYWPAGQLSWKPSNSWRQLPPGTGCPQARPRISRLTGTLPPHRSRGRTPQECATVPNRGPPAAAARWPA